MESWTSCSALHFSIKLSVLYKAKVVEIGSNYTEVKCCLHGSCHLHKEVFKMMLSVEAIFQPKVGGTSCWASNH